MLIPIDEVVTFDVVTHDPSTSGISDADSAPTYDVFEETTDTPILSAQTTTKRTGKTGNYRGTFTASAASGFEAGKWYSVIASGTVNGVSAKCVAKHFRCGPAENTAGVPLVDVSLVDGVAPPTVDDAADAIFKRDWTAITGEAARSLLNAARFLRNRWFIDPGSPAILHVKKEDDTTDAWTATVSSTPAADPITGNDPS